MMMIIQTQNMNQQSRKQSRMRVIVEMSLNLVNPFMKFASGSGGAPFYKELTRKVLASDDPQFVTDSFEGEENLMIIINGTVKSATADPSFSYNSDYGTNFAYRQSAAGASDFTVTSSRWLAIASGYADMPFTSVIYTDNLSDEEKIGVQHHVDTYGTGAGNPPYRRESVLKWANTSNAITTISCWTTQSVTSPPSAFDSGAGSECIVLGFSDGSSGDTVWEELDSVATTGTTDSLNSNTFTGKDYLLVQIWANYTGDTNTKMTFNSDTGTNYSQRQSYAGGADGTRINQANIGFDDSSVKDSLIQSMFITNKSDQEKTAIMFQGTGTNGAANAPYRIETYGKWANTSSQITSIQLSQTNSGSYLADTTMKIWGFS